MPCNQKKCTALPIVRYTWPWPGHDERRSCLSHAMTAARVANVMGFKLQLVPLTTDELSQEIELKEVDGLTGQALLDSANRTIQLFFVDAPEP